MENGDSSVKKFYPRIVELAKSPVAEVRKTVAWVMGQDNTSEDFHRALLELLRDPEPLVRRNAALQLVRFGDASGRMELRAMLQSFEVKAPFSGMLVSLLGVGSNVRAGSLLARIRDASGNVQEFRSPVDGAINSLAVKEGDAVTAGQTLALLNPDLATINDAFRAPVDGTIAAPVAKEGEPVTANQTIAWLTPDRASVGAALRALAYVGTKDDLPVIESCAQADASRETAEQAGLTAKAIRQRLGQNL